MGTGISGFVQFFNMMLLKLRTSLIYSVVNLSTNQLVFHMKFDDILLFSLGLHFISEIYINIQKNSKANWLVGRWGFVTYLFHTLSRQAVFVISEVLSLKFATSGKHDTESTLILVFTTCFFVVVFVLLPDWFLRCEERGPFKRILLFSICARFNVLKIPGLQGGVSCFAYGSLYLTTISIMKHFEGKTSEFRTQLLSASAMIWSNLFITVLVPSTQNSVLPFVTLLALYILAASFNLFEPVESFCLWKVSASIRNWILAIFPYLGPVEIFLIVLVSCALTLFTKVEKLHLLSIMCLIQVSISQILTLTREHFSSYSFVLSMLLLVLVDILLIQPQKKLGRGTQV